MIKNRKIIDVVLLYVLEKIKKAKNIAFDLMFLAFFIFVTDKRDCNKIFP